MILVTGSPRSGTKSMAKMLRSTGLDVKHEKLGADGTSSCFYFIENSYPYPYIRKGVRAHDGDTKFSRKQKWDTVIHVVRNPLSCISSMKSIVGKAHQEWLHDVGLVTEDHKTKLSWCMEAWLMQNQFIDRMFPSATLLQIENAVRHWPFRTLPMEATLNRSSGNRKAVALSRNDLFDADEKLARQIVTLAKRYGYRV